MTGKLLLIFCFILIGSPSIVLANQKGYYIFDARKHDFNDTNTLKIGREWQFHYGDFLSADKMENAPSIPIKVPSSWNGVEWQGQKLTGQGAATYRVIVLLDHAYEKLALKIPDQATAYKVYVNGKYIGGAGKISISSNEARPQTKPQIIEFPLHTNKLDLVFHVSNFHHKKGGLWEPVTLGNKNVLYMQQTKRIYYDIFLVGAILILAFYHLGIYILQKSNTSALLLALMALSAAVRVLSTGEKFIMELFPSIDWSWRVSLEHISFYLISGFGCLFSHYLFPKEFRKSIVFPITLLSIALSISNALTPTLFNSYFIIPFEIVILVLLVYLTRGMSLAIYRKRKSAIPYSLGFLFISLAGINDILVSNYLISSVYLTPFGIFLFFFFQAFVLSAKSADAFNKVEKLSSVLQNINKSLEDKVAERTKEIADKNNQLEQNATKLRTINIDLEDTKSNLEDALEKEHNFRLELEHALNQLKEAQAQLIQSEKMVSLGQLTAGIAHEINNPMNFIYVGVEVLKELIAYNRMLLDKYSELEQVAPSNVAQKLKEITKVKKELEFDDMQVELEQVVDDINQGVNRTIEIINGLRDFSRSDDLDMAAADIHQCIDSTLIILKNQYKHNIKIIQNYDQSLPFVHCNTGQINQVLMNLLVNAIHAIEGAGSITISTKTESQEIISISVLDTGKGIPKEIIDNIFDPFFTTKPVGEGTGLGLSISHGIIEKHKGRLEAKSQVGQGSEFTIFLPIRSDTQKL